MPASRSSSTPGPPTVPSKRPSVAAVKPASRADPESFDRRARSVAARSPATLEPPFSTDASSSASSGLAEREPDQPLQLKWRRDLSCPGRDQPRELLLTEPFYLDTHNRPRVPGDEPEQLLLELGADGRDHSDRLLVQPTQREPERSTARRVDPLCVVDCHHDGRRGGECAENSSDSQCERYRIHARADLPSAERLFEREPLARRKRSERLLVGRPEEICQHRERKLRLSLGGSRHEDTAGARRRGVEHGRPDGRLADSRLADEEQPARPPGGLVQEAECLRQLALSTNHDAVHAPITSPPVEQSMGVSRFPRRFRRPSSRT